MSSSSKPNYFLKPLFKLKLFLYILKEILSPFILSLFIFLLTILMVQMFRFTDVMLIYGSDINSLLSLLKSLLISTFPIIIPLSFLSALLLGYGRMSQDSELVAFSSLGYPKRSLLLPSYLLCAVCSILCFYCVTDLGPKGIKISKILSSRIASETLASNLKPGVFITFGNMTVYVESLDKKTQNFGNFFVLDQRTESPAVILSHSGQIISQQNQASFLNMKNGQVHFNPKEINHAVIDFQEYNFVTDSETQKNANLPLKALTNSEILGQKKFQNLDFNHRLEIHKRYQLSLVCFVFLILGLAFGFSIFQRVSRAEGLGFCIFMAMAYWILYFIFESLASNAKLIFYVYVPNVLFLGLGLIWMFYKNDSFVLKFKKTVKS